MTDNILFARIKVVISLQETNTDYYYNRNEMPESATEFVIPIIVAESIDYTAIVKQVVKEVQEKYAESLKEKPE
jgi:hypothetical protein